MVSLLWSGQSIRPCCSLITRQTHTHVNTQTNTHTPLGSGQAVMNSRVSLVERSHLHHKELVGIRGHNTSADNDHDLRGLQIQNAPQTFFFVFSALVATSFFYFHVSLKGNSIWQINLNVRAHVWSLLWKSQVFGRYTRSNKRQHRVALREG